jgi:hypothetical protein
MALIGAVINLFSASNIRYMGTLYSYNAVDKTVSLQNGALPPPAYSALLITHGSHEDAVRSFGTEGRTNGAREVPGSATVYPFIEFRASDIKDLAVVEQAAPAPPAAAELQDPAIVSVCHRARRPVSGARLTMCATIDAWPGACLCARTCACTCARASARASASACTYGCTCARYHGAGTAAPASSDGDGGSCAGGSAHLWRL